MHEVKMTLLECRLTATCLLIQGELTIVQLLGNFVGGQQPYILSRAIESRCRLFCFGLCADLRRSMVELLKTRFNHTETDVAQRSRYPGVLTLQSITQAKLRSSGPHRRHL